MPEKQSSGRGGKRPGAGRPKGALDKGNARIREMIVEALGELGGVSYLVSTAQSHPQAFMALLGKVMPLQIEGGDKPIEHVARIELVPLK
jgi:hypothetical protein